MRRIRSLTYYGIPEPPPGRFRRGVAAFGTFCAGVAWAALSLIGLLVVAGVAVYIVAALWPF